MCRGSRQGVEPNFKDEIRDAKVGPSKLADDGAGEIERSELDAPPLAPTVDQSPPWIPVLLH